jgi:hypothetical protein
VDRVAELDLEEAREFSIIPLQILSHFVSVNQDMFNYGMNNVLSRGMSTIGSTRLLHSVDDDINREVQIKLLWRVIRLQISLQFAW